LLFGADSDKALTNNVQCLLFGTDPGAITRAKDDLYLTYPMMNPKSYSGDIICRPSRFLEDFPAEMVEEWQVGNSDPWGDDEPF